LKQDNPAARRARELLYTARYVINAHPSIYMPFTRLKHRGKGDWAVARDTELVIEGFGRSGSTFALIAFDLAQKRAVKSAHHTHAAAQVATAVKMGIPTLVIVRDPAQATASHMVRRGISARPALASWIRFHEHILPHRDGVVFASFEALTSDFGAVIRDVNTRFGTSFEEFEHTPANEARVMELIEERNLEKFGRQTEFVARPTADREALKRSLRAEFEAPRLARLRLRAYAVYRTLVPSPRVT
jgi:hypothetical protein